MKRLAVALLLVSCATPGLAQVSYPPSSQKVEDIVVVGRRLNLVGEAVSASEGSVGRIEIDSRPLLRSGDLLEFVPGLVATQHSGSGKANQYFLRGFNLDHGTDFATSVDTMPVNMRTHGHGQGYTDLNFLIPEAVDELTYRKGTYYADVGDFSSAGSAQFHIADRLDRGLAEGTAGEYGFARGVVVDSVAAGPKAHDGALLYALEYQTFDGPWTDIKEDVQKVSGLLRYSQDLGPGRFHLMAMAYDNSWTSHDQIPQRAVDSGLIDAYGNLDTTVGGESDRYSLSAGWAGAMFGGKLDASAYVIRSDLDLFSNFTYFLDDPIDGDQFEQVDDRTVYGFGLSQQWDAGRSRWRVGAQGRYDDISKVGLYRTKARARLGTVREDGVDEGSIGLFAANEYRFSDRLRTYVGLRYDRFNFDVNALSLPVNSGKVSDDATSLKASLIYTPIKPLEFYLSYGQGFHSNDARGTTITVDPVSGDPVDRVDPLVKSDGAEVGARLFLTDRLQATAAIWTLKLDSELLFVGDAGNTEASRPSRRDGVEIGLYWFASDNLNAEIEASYTDAYFTDDDPAGDDIPGSLPLVISGGISGHTDDGWMATARLRYFAAYPLIEDDSVESGGTTVVNFRVGKSWRDYGVFIDVLNAFDSSDHDIDYFYASRLAGEPSDGVEDTHFNIIQPRQVRLSLRRAF